MTWVIWRLHRTETLIGAGALALLLTFLVITGLMMAHTFQDSGLAACLAHTANPDACGPLKPAFLNQYGPVLVVPLALVAVPVLLGALVGAPLVARELEQRTHLLLWMQSITPLRWLTVSLGLVMGAVLVAGGAVLVLLMWWYHPFAQLLGRFAPGPYDFSGPVLPAATVMALALGVAVGGLTRRTVSAIFLTLVLVLAIRVPVELFLRPNFETQITITWPIANGDTPPVRLSVQDWQIGQGYIDAHGNKTNVISCRGTVSNTAALTPTQCREAGGFRDNYLSYQPANRFWTFQWIETGIYLVVSALAVALSFWLLRSRAV